MAPIAHSNAHGGDQPAIRAASPGSPRMTETSGRSADPFELPGYRPILTELHGVEQGVAIGDVLCPDRALLAGADLMQDIGLLDQTRTLQRRNRGKKQPNLIFFRGNGSALPRFLPRFWPTSAESPATPTEKLR
jgi:hypothetical protein